jgi:hypothetical protein
VSLFSTKHYSADNLANECNLASADDRASADDLEIQYHLASADDLESRHKQTAAPTRKPTNPTRLCPREAVKFNDGQVALLSAHFGWNITVGASK